MILNEKSFFKIIFIFSILLAPFLNSGELFSLIQGTLTSQEEVLTPYYIKILKDIIFLIFILFGTIKILFSRFNRYSFYFLTLILSLTLVNCINSQGELYEKLSGVRFMIPIAIVSVFINFKNIKELIFAIEIPINIIFFIHFVAQLYQFFFSISWFGLNFMGFSLRNPGIFLLPNTGAFFTIIVLFMNLYIFDKHKNTSFFLFFLSVILTMSGTGMIAFFILIITYFTPKKLLPLSLLVSLFFVKGLLKFVNIFREDFLKISGGTRFEIFKDILLNTKFFSERFGLYTNTYMLLKKDGLIVDSFYGALIGNLGLLGGIIIIGIIFYNFVVSLICFEKQYNTIFLIIILFSFSTIITEAYPMNLLIPLLIAYIFEKKKGDVYEYRS